MGGAVSVLIVPDLCANLSGVIVSESLFLDEEGYNERLLRIIRGNSKRVWDYFQQQGVTIRCAAFC